MSLLCNRTLPRISRQVETREERTSIISYYPALINYNEPMKQDFLLSLVIPVYNEESNITPLLNKLLPLLKPYRYEILFVNDGSIDETSKEIQKHTKDKSIKYIEFNRNFGHQMALSCGYAMANGDAVISMDADLQDPPEVIGEMVEAWQKGSLIVYAQRAERDVDSAFKRWSARQFYNFINSLSDTPIPRDVGDFRLLDRQVVEYLNELPEQSRFYRGLVAWGGFPSSCIQFRREARFSGKTHYTFSKMANFALDGITSFSTKPLRMATLVGFWTAVIGFLGIIYALVGRFLHPAFFPQEWVTGWTGLFVAIMFLGGIQLVTIGIIGEYIGKIYTQVQQRPRYIIKEKINV